MDTAAITDRTRIIDALIAQGLDYSIAEDKAFMGNDTKGEAMAHGGHLATVKALAIVLGVEPMEAAARILAANPEPTQGNQA